MLNGLFALLGAIGAWPSGASDSGSKLLDSSPRAPLRDPQGAGAGGSPGGTGGPAGRTEGLQRNRKPAKKVKGRPSLETLRTEVRLLCRESERLCGELAKITQDLKETHAEKVTEG